QDIQDDRTLLRVIQKSRDKALNEGDSVELRWHDQIASTQVDYAEGDNATTLWQDANFEVRPVDGGYCYWRRKDNIRMTTALFPTWEAAKQACIRDQAGVRLGRTVQIGTTTTRERQSLPKCHRSKPSPTWLSGVMSQCPAPARKRSWQIR